MGGYVRRVYTERRVDLIEKDLERKATRCREATYQADLLLEQGYDEEKVERALDKLIKEIYGLKD